jgi:hypothetical protein
MDLLTTFQELSAASQAIVMLLTSLAVGVIAHDGIVLIRKQFKLKQDE